MKLDIKSRKDLEKIISVFYQKLINDSELFPFFKDIVARDDPKEGNITVFTWNMGKFCYLESRTYAKILPACFDWTRPLSNQVISEYTTYFDISKVFLLYPIKC